jgi:hypothetical protein
MMHQLLGSYKFILGMFTATNVLKCPMHSRYMKPSRLSRYGMGIKQPRITKFADEATAVSEVMQRTLH